MLGEGTLQSQQHHVHAQVHPMHSHAVLLRHVEIAPADAAADVQNALTGLQIQGLNEFLQAPDQQNQTGGPDSMPESCREDWQGQPVQPGWREMAVSRVSRRIDCLTLPGRQVTGNGRKGGIGIGIMTAACVLVHERAYLQNCMPCMSGSAQLLPDPCGSQKQ